MHSGISHVCKVFIQKFLPEISAPSVFRMSGENFPVGFQDVTSEKNFSIFWGDAISIIQQDLIQKIWYNIDTNIHFKSKQIRQCQIICQNLQQTYATYITYTAISQKVRVTVETCKKFCLMNWRSGMEHGCGRVRCHTYQTPEAHLHMSHTNQEWMESIRLHCNTGIWIRISYSCVWIQMFNPKATALLTSGQYGKFSIGLPWWSTLDPIRPPMIWNPSWSGFAWDLTQSWITKYSPLIYSSINRGWGTKG